MPTQEYTIRPPNGQKPPIPTDLTNEPYVFWRWEERNGKPTKIPYDPKTGNRADTTDPDTWGTFDQVTIAVDKYGGDGVGVVFTPDSTLAGVDLDDCRDPDTEEIHPDAQKEIDRLRSYTEVSPSRTGVKVLLHGIKPGPRCKKSGTAWGGDIELYDSGRFFTITGDHVDGTPSAVLSRQKAFADLYTSTFGEAVTGPPQGANRPASGIGPLTDDELLAEAERISGDKFRSLFHSGNISTYGGDDSRGRSALIGMLRWYAHDDPEQIERLMRRSALNPTRFDERRGDKRFLRYEIDRLTADALAHYYEPGGEFVSVDYKNPHQQKRNGLDGEGDSGFVSADEGGPNRQKRKALPFKSAQDLIAASGGKPDWVWHGFLARGWFTDLTGPAKRSGKTTLMMHAVRHILDGRPFLDYPTQQSKIVYLTEQSDSVAEAIKKAGLDAYSDDVLRILQWKDTRAWSWEDLVEDAFTYAADFGAGLVIVDTLNKFAGLRGEDENQAGPVSDAMNPLLMNAQEHRMSVLSVRHANKEGKARGSTQFDHDVDILLELQAAGGNGGENVRELHGVGRSDDVPAKVSAELTEGGYVNLGSDAKVRFTAAIRAVKAAVSRDARNPTPKPVLEDLLKAQGVALTTGRDAVTRLVNEGEIIRTGEGKRGSPYAYHAGGPGDVPLPIHADERIDIPCS